MNRWNQSLLAVLALAGISALAGACGTGDEVVNVFAASSLAEAMDQFEREFEATHPGIDVRVNLGGSNNLARLITDDAPVDVFAAADVELFRGLPGVSDTEVFATNQLTVVLAENQTSPAGPAGLVDVAVARCAAGVPCGNATDQFLEQSGIRLGLVTEETNVRAVLTKVQQGEVDAGFVYRTDAIASGLDELPLSSGPTVKLGVSALGGSSIGQEFVNMMKTSQSQDLLAELGFGLPS